MTHNTRYPFINALVLGSGLLFATLVNAQVTLTIDESNPGSKINKDVYGQFMEHLGRGIYEGIWVGEDSPIPNTRGYRNDVLAALKDLHVPLLRWPGGCFADEYHWRNGIGPRGQRPVTVNTNWGGVTDDNAFGTHEFMDLAEMLGADVYINGNLGTGTPQEMAEWLEYLTSPLQSSLANLRRANGRDEPWQIKYFAIGNETWGCGGTMTPEYYSDLFKHYSSFLKSPEGNKPIIIASGDSDESTLWTRVLLENIPPFWSMRLDAISHHYYTVPTGIWEKKGNATNFPKEEWLSTLVYTQKIDDYIKTNLALMDKHDPEKKIGFYVDEWGTWYDTEEGDNPGFLFQQNTIRDAVVAALNFNIFHEYADRIQMTNIAQMVNVLQAMILTDKEKMLLTPTYHVFRMYVPFQEATHLPLSYKNNPVLGRGKNSIRQLSATAARTAEGKTVLALTNVDPDNPLTVTVNGDWKAAQGQILTAEALDAHNTFANANAVAPRAYRRESTDQKLVLDIPAKSVVVLELN